MILCYHFDRGSVMDSRMNKYSDDEKMSRVSKNASLYKEINDSELDNFSVKSNATVIGNQEPEIDIDKIRRILDMKYNEAPKRRSIRVEPREEESKVADDVPTKEYDLNVILEKAKGEKTETYEEARAKKLRNTQYDILNNLNIDNKEDDEYSNLEENENTHTKPEMKKAEEDLMELINTITINEAKIKEEEKKATLVEEAKQEVADIDPLSILEDLKGDDDTAVYEKMAEEVAVEATSNIVLKDENDDKKDDTTIDDSFYTKSLFKKKDFEDEDDDFTDSKTSVWVKIVIVVVVIAFAVGLFLFLRSFLNL